MDLSFPIIILVYTIMNLLIELASVHARQHAQAQEASLL